MSSMSRPPATDDAQPPRHAESDLTAVEHWDDTWAEDIRMRLPSSWVIANRDIQRLLATHIREGDRVLEVGCAPGKLLAWAASARRARVSGVDFSKRGMEQARRLFEALHLDVDLRREDLRETTFPANSFDLVYSVGVIEHFEDPREIVRDHLSLVRPGGTALMTVPNYRGIYGRLQRYFFAESLLYHNLAIMTCDALEALAPRDQGLRVRCYPYGRLSPWLLSTSKRWPSPVAFAASHLVNAAAHLQPVDIVAVCPLLVLEIGKPAAK